MPQRQSNKEILFDLSGGTPKVIASRQDVPVSPLDAVAQLGDLIIQGSGKVAEAAGVLTGAPSVERTLTGEGDLLDILETVGTAADVATPAIPLLPLLGALFHGTSSLRLPGILKKGLQARRELSMAEPIRVPLGSPGKRPAAFLTDDLNFAGHAADMKTAGDVQRMMGTNRNLSFDERGAIRAQLERQIQPAILEFPESVRPRGTPDDLFLGEKATMFPEGLEPSDIEQGVILPDDFQMLDIDIEELFRSVPQLGADANARIAAMARILSGFPRR